MTNIHKAKETPTLNK